MRTFSGRLRELDKWWYIPLVRPQNFYFCFENNLFHGIYDICNSFSAYGQRSSLKADPGVFQRGGCKYGSSRQTSQGQKNAGRGSVRVRVSVMFEYVECVDFLRFAFRGINLRHYC